MYHLLLDGNSFSYELIVSIIRYHAVAVLRSGSAQWRSRWCHCCAGYLDHLATKRYLQKNISGVKPKEGRNEGLEKSFYRSLRDILAIGGYQSSLVTALFSFHTTVSLK